MNRRKFEKVLQPQQCRALEHAWHLAAKDGFPLNALVTVRLQAGLDHSEQADIITKTWNRLAVWSRRHTPTKSFRAVLVRETVPYPHFHVLMHVTNSAALAALRAAVQRWFPEMSSVDVRRAHQGIAYTASGKVRSAVGYVSKERSPQAAWPRWQYRKGLEVFGKRYKISANLRRRADQAPMPAQVTERVLINKTV